MKFIYSYKELYWHETTREVEAESLAQAKELIDEDISNCGEHVETDCYHAEYDPKEDNEAMAYKPVFDPLDEFEGYPLLMLHQSHQFTLASAEDLNSVPSGIWGSKVYEDILAHISGGKTKFTYVSLENSSLKELYQKDANIDKVLARLDKQQQNLVRDLKHSEELIAKYQKQALELDKKLTVVEVAVSKKALDFFRRDFSGYSRYELALPEERSTESILYCLEDLELQPSEELELFYTLLRANTDLNEEKLKPYDYLCLYTA